MDASKLSKDAYYRVRPAQLAFRESAYTLPKAIRDFGVPVPIDAVYAANVMTREAYLAISAEEAGIRHGKKS